MGTDDRSRLYFVALIPDEPLRTTVQQLKKEASISFDSSHALNSPPHITLVPPFRMKKSLMEKAEEVLIDAALRYPPLNVRLDGFGHFGKKVIFINVENSSELQELQSELEQKMLAVDVIRFRTHEEYHPHMTVAFKDLKPSRFEEAMEYFALRDFSASFRAEFLYLLRHEDGLWREERSFRLSA